MSFSQIKITYDGINSTSLDSDGRLILNTKWGDIVATLGTNTESEGSATLGFETDGGNSYRFANTSQSLASASSKKIGLAYSTYLGDRMGEGYTAGWAIAVDSLGCAYVTGFTGAWAFPTVDAFQWHHQYPSMMGWDAYVTKFSSTGNQLVYSTYLGGHGVDMGGDEPGLGIAVDREGCACVTGWTTSYTFPLLNPYQSTFVGGQAFVTKLSNTGNQLVFSTYLGGSSYDEGYGIAVDASNDVYVTGYTNSEDFPTLNPFQTGPGAFVAKFSSVGTLLYSTCLEGCTGYAIAINVEGQACVTGSAVANFATLNPIQSYQGSVDAFVLKLNDSGDGLLYSTFLGGSNTDRGEGIAISGEGDILVTGQTNSSDFPTVNPLLGYQGMRDIFVTKLNSAGTTILYSTYLGGVDNDGTLTDESGGAIAVDNSGRAWVTGTTKSSGFPTLSPLQSFCGISTENVFVVQLDVAGDSLLFGTFLCGFDGNEGGTGIAVDKLGGAYVTGITTSSDFPTMNPFQRHVCPDAPGGGCNGLNAFVTKLAECPCIDPNSDSTIDISDQVFLIAYVFCGGPRPMPLSKGDINSDGAIDVSDIVYLGEVIFHGIAPLCSNCD